MVGKMGERLHSLSPCRQQRGESLMSPHVEVGVWVGEEVIAARLFASARESAGRGCETHVPFVGCRVIAGDRRSSTRRACPGESRGL